MRLLLVLILASSCYQQPALTGDRPLSCASGDARGDCPTGFVCVADRVCAPRNCRGNEDCPTGLVCGGRGCQLPPPDGGREPAAPMPGPATTPDASPDALADGGGN